MNHKDWLNQAASTKKPEPAPSAPKEPAKAEAPAPAPAVAQVAQPPKLATIPRFQDKGVMSMTTDRKAVSRANAQKTLLMLTAETDARLKAETLGSKSQVIEGLIIFALDELAKRGETLTVTFE